MQSHERARNDDYPLVNDSGVDGSAFSDEELEPELTWIEWFCRIKENRFFVEVEEDYVRDDFNLTGLVTLVPHYHKALERILSDGEDNDFSGPESGSESDRTYDASAAALFGLIHARFILTTQGLHMMLEKYKERTYGVCPNTKCRDQPVMPIGLADAPKVSKSLVYCPRCREVYYPKSARLRNLDGAFFGTTFAPLFFMQYSHLSDQDRFPDYYIPRVFGFKVSPECRNPDREADGAEPVSGGDRLFAKKTNQTIR